MKAYSMDIRTRVLAACDAGEGTTAVARRFAVSPAWVRRLKQFRRELGIIGPRPINGRAPAKIDRVKLQQLVEVKPDATLAELRQMLDVQCSISAICMALKKLSLSYKKSRFMPPSRIVRT